MANFNRMFPGWQTHWLVPRNKLSAPGSEWTEGHCVDLRVLEERQKENYAIPQLRRYMQDAEIEIRENQNLRGYLNALGSVKELRVPPEQLAVETGPFLGFYNLLSVVIERIPAQVIRSRDVLGTRNRARVVNPDFQTGSEFTSSSSVDDSMEEEDGSFRSSSQATADTDEDKDAIKSEAVTQNMATAFLTTTLTYYRLNNWDPNKRMRPEFSPAMQRFEVNLRKTQFEYVAVDDGGVDFRGYDVDGKWTTLAYPRSACLECKRRVVDALPQHVAEMIGLVVKKLSFAGVDLEDEDSIAKLTNEQRTMFVISVQGKMLEVKGATFSTKWLRENLGKQHDHESSPVSSPASSPASSPPSFVALRSEQRGGESGDNPTNNDAMSIDTHDEQSGEDEVESGIDSFLQVYSGSPHDLSTPKGRTTAAIHIKALFEFIEDNAVEQNEAVDEM